MMTTLTKGGPTLEELCEMKKLFDEAAVPPREFVIYLNEKGEIDYIEGRIIPTKEE